MPIVIMLYIDSAGNLKAYVLKNGNAYCKSENCTWGNEQNSEFNKTSTMCLIQLNYIEMLKIC